MAMMKKGISKGRAKRAPLAKGSQSKGRRVKKEKVPTKFIVNPERGGGDGEVWRGAVALSESDEETDIEVVKKTEQHQDGNRATRRKALRYELDKKKYEEEFGGVILKRRRLQKGREIEYRMTSEERENLKEQRAHQQGGFMKYNYLQCHPSWSASKQLRRKQQESLLDHEIQIFNDVIPPKEEEPPPIEEHEEEQEEREEQEEQEEEDYEERDDANIEPLYPSLEPVRRRTVWKENCFTYSESAIHHKDDDNNSNSSSESESPTGRQHTVLV